MKTEKMTFSQWVKYYLPKQTKHVLIRIIQLLYIKYRKKTNSDYYTPRSRYEKEAIKICRNIVQNSDTLLEMSPNGERYATNDRLDLIYFIYDNSVDVIKNNISREIVTSPKTHDTILNIFDGHVKMRRDAKKEKVFSNLKSTLESIVIETKNDITGNTKNLNKSYLDELNSKIEEKNNLKKK